MVELIVTWCIYPCIEMGILLPLERRVVSKTMKSTFCHNTTLPCHQYSAWSTHFIYVFVIPCSGFPHSSTRENIPTAVVARRATRCHSTDPLHGATAVTIQADVATVVFKGLARHIYLPLLRPPRSSSTSTSSSYTGGGGTARQWPGSWGYPRSNSAYVSILFGATVACLAITSNDE